MEALFEAPAKLPSVVAQFHGTCAICEYRILAHEETIVKVAGAWVHTDCAAAEGHEVMGE